MRPRTDHVVDGAVGEGHALHHRQVGCLDFGSALRDPSARLLEVSQQLLGSRLGLPGLHLGCRQRGAGCGGCGGFRLRGGLRGISLATQRLVLSLHPREFHDGVNRVFHLRLIVPAYDLLTRILTELERLLQLLILGVSAGGRPCDVGHARQLLARQRLDAGELNGLPHLAIERRLVLGFVLLQGARRRPRPVLLLLLRSLRWHGRTWSRQIGSWRRRQLEAQARRRRCCSPAWHLDRRSCAHRRCRGRCPCGRSAHTRSRRERGSLSQQTIGEQARTPRAVTLPGRAPADGPAHRLLRRHARRQRRRRRRGAPGRRGRCRGHGSRRVRAAHSRLTAQVHRVAEVRQRVVLPHEGGGLGRIARELARPVDEVRATQPNHTRASPVPLARRLEARQPLGRGDRCAEADVVAVGHADVEPHHANHHLAGVMRAHEGLELPQGVLHPERRLAHAFAECDHRRVVILHGRDGPVWRGLWPATTTERVPAPPANLRLGGGARERHVRGASVHPKEARGLGHRQRHRHASGWW
mmetsp:Transcript_10635/g.43965  ORF Transcript_10635/g.43965 Transcript_10635/m.43965 type:complete len:527 (+) Transcript_10635:2443-4023(+)